MKRPWQVWMLFGASLAMVLPGMFWLTQKALELDRAEALAQQHAELEETVGSALWQMDTDLTRLLATEIARPSSFYRAFDQAEDALEEMQQVASSPSMQSSPYVRLHFEIYPDGRWTSPQCPDPEPKGEMSANEGTRDNQHRRQWLRELTQSIRYDELVARLPQQDLEPGLFTQNTLAANTALMPSSGKVFQNLKDLGSFQQPSDGGKRDQAQSGFDGRSEPSEDSGMNSYALARNQRIQQLRGNELLNREEALQAAAQQAIVDFNYLPGRPLEEQSIGVSQPLWIGTRLVLARRATVSGQTVIQGCWLDWPEIKTALLQRVRPILPRADLQPMDDSQHVRLSRVLATLPVQLVVPDAVPVVNPRSPIRVSLGVAWAFLLLATGSMAVLLRGVVALSERRAAFVSAVTHELRTPLTTFRMYAEMLAEGMVPEGAQRTVYFQTLKAEADRLTHLVDNVLQYARLERGNPGKRRESVRVEDLLRRIEPRLRDRATEAEMILTIEADGAVGSLQIVTDPAAVEQILFNLVDNACKYAKDSEDRRIHCRFQAAAKDVYIEVRDHGPGISTAELRRLFRPFSKSAQAAANSAPGVGLGLALSRRLASQLGGRLDVKRANGPGATFTLRLPRGT